MIVNTRPYEEAAAVASISGEDTVWVHRLAIRLAASQQRSTKRERDTNSVFDHRPSRQRRRGEDDASRPDRSDKTGARQFDDSSGQCLRLSAEGWGSCMRCDVGRHSFLPFRVQISAVFASLVIRAGGREIEKQTSGGQVVTPAHKAHKVKHSSITKDEGANRGSRPVIIGRPIQPHCLGMRVAVKGDDANIDVVLE